MSDNPFTRYIERLDLSGLDEAPPPAASQLADLGRALARLGRLEAARIALEYGLKHGIDVDVSAILGESDE